jgi:hypothetical protein
VIKRKDGRRNRYQIQAHLPLPEPPTQEPAIGEVPALLAGAGARLQLTRTRPGNWEHAGAWIVFPGAAERRLGPRRGAGLPGWLTRREQFRIAAIPVLLPRGGTVASGLGSGRGLGLRRRPAAQGEPPWR